MTSAAKPPVEPARTNSREHWDAAYRSRAADEVSWFQRDPQLSRALITDSGIAPDAGVLDVGGGASTLADHLLDDGYTRLAVLDWSGLALARSRERLGDRAGEVQWFEADVRSFVPPRRFGLWHDRAVFHFLTTGDDRRRYVEALQLSLRPGGSLVIATFALDGPRRCSGLEVMRYDERGLLAELGSGFELQEVRRESHVTPRNAVQQFLYCRLQWKPA